MTKVRRAVLWAHATCWRQFAVCALAGLAMNSFLSFVMSATQAYTLVAQAALQVVVLIAQPSVAKVAEMRAQLAQKPARSRRTDGG